MKASKLKKRSRKYFDKLAETDQVIDEPVLCYEAVMKRLLERRFRSLADIGCGTGEMLRRLADACGENVRLCGVDLSPKSIEAARTKLPDAVRLMVGDVDDLPLGDECVDIVLNMHSFHHYPDPDNALRQLCRVLRKGERLYLVENRWSFWRRIRINFHYIRRRHREGDVKVYSVEQLERMLSKAGFTILETEAIGEHSILLVCRKK